MLSGKSLLLSFTTVKQEIFASAIFAFPIVIKFCENIFLRFLLLVYRQSIEHRNICVLNFCNRSKILKNAKISCSTVVDLFGTAFLSY